MRASRRGRRIAHALERAREHTKTDPAAQVDETAARMDRLAALRTAELITEDDFNARCAALLDRAPSTELGQVR